MNTNLYYTYILRWQCTGVPGMRIISRIMTAKDTRTPEHRKKPISFGFERKLSPCWICGPELEPCWFKYTGDLQANKPAKLQFT